MHFSRMREELGIETVWNSDAEKHVKQNCDLDPGILHFPACKEFLFPPVYQCPDGHSMHSGCCEKLNPSGSRSSCSKPIGTIRNIALEKIIESLVVSCRRHGCNTKMKYTENGRAIP